MNDIDYGLPTYPMHVTKLRVTITPKSRRPVTPVIDTSISVRKHVYHLSPVGSSNDKTPPRASQASFVIKSLLPSSTTGLIRFGYYRSSRKLRKGRALRPLTPSRVSPSPTSLSPWNSPKSTASILLTTQSKPILRISELGKRLGDMSRLKGTIRRPETSMLPRRVERESRGGVSPWQRED